VPLLSLRLLGEIEVLRDGRRLSLPPSRKTRALLGYLAATAKPHRRERLCTIFWEIPDDPRGALRWSLSRLRALVDDPGQPRIAATRDTVAFEAAGADVDLLQVRERMRSGFPAISVDDLESLAGAFQGEFLEGIDLPDLHDFQAWCLAEREDLRRMQARILSTLIGKLGERADAALPHARTLVKIDPFNEAARASLLRTLVTLGRRTEAERHFDAAVCVFKELEDGAELGLLRTWRKLMENPPALAAHDAPALVTPAETVTLAQAVPKAGSAAGPLVGRTQQWNRIVELIGATAGAGQCQVALLLGEPGMGKSALIGEMQKEATARGMITFCGRAYETDRGHPYSPWIEALGTLPDVSDPDASTGATERLPSMRDRLFSAVAERLCADDRPVLLAIDDVQWCDEASADLLQYVVRTARQRPLLVVLTARAGELSDNLHLHAHLRTLRQAQPVHEIRLSPLDAGEMAELLRTIAPEIDPAPVVSQSGGNPLYAIEIARSLAGSTTEVPGSLKELVRDRVDRLPAHAAETLRWSSILGPWFSLDRLVRIAPLALDELTSALEIIERHELLRTVPANGRECEFRFTHDLVHRAIYTGLSEPRRRLMHLKAARALKAMESNDEDFAADVAHHAGLAGEAGMAAAACLAAARRCLRLFANADAESLARKGQRYAETLAEPEQVQRLLELIQVELLARPPADRSQAIARVDALAERAVDHGCLEHARLGYHILSHLRWEGGLWSDARRDTLRAEFVSRSGDEKQQVHAIAEAARCLAMLERDLGHAEALALEARAMSTRLGVEPNAVSDATGLLRMHLGELDEAAEQFKRAQDVARRDGDRTSEFIAIEHRIELELQRRRYADAERLCAELIALSEKLRDGSEIPFARAIHAFARWAQNLPDAQAEFERRLPGLRAADAKHRLSLVLLHAAERDVNDGDLVRARTRAEEALELAIVLDRASEIVIARSILARIAAQSGAADDWQRHSRAVRDLATERQRLSRQAAAQADMALRCTLAAGALPAPRASAAARRPARTAAL